MHVWSKLSSKKWEDAWEDRFCGNPNAVIEEFRNKTRIRISVYCDEKAGADALQEQFGGSVRELKNANWVAMSSVVRKPMKIRDRLVIVGEVEGKGLKKRREEFSDRTVLSFPPEMAFGTGDHETTSTVLRFLVDQAAEWKREGRQWSCLDAGCGTGILAIAAMHLGAAECYGFDFDPQAIEVAGHSKARNAAEKVTFEVQDVLKWHSETKYDLIVANIFASILREAFPRIKKWLKADGVLMISGILADQWEETRAVAEGQGFEFELFKQKGKWVSAKCSFAG